MRPAANRLFCRVDRKTLEVVEGPKPLPQKWGNVTGFNNLRAPDVKKYGWYPMAEFSLVDREETFSLVFLPEKEHVVKVYPLNGAQGLQQHAIALLRAGHQHALASVRFRSTALGEPLLFPNAPADAEYRHSCFLLAKDYECMAQTLDGEHRFVTVPFDKIEALMLDIHARYSQLNQKLKEGLEQIANETPAGLRALLDTDLVDLYDD